VGDKTGTQDTQEIGDYMAKVLLINPSIQGSLYKTPCLGLAYLGASLKKAGHEVMLVDGSLSKTDDKMVARLVIEWCPDYIGLTGFTLQYPAVKEVFYAVKRLNKRTITVFGGQHASALSEYIMKDVPEIDFVIKGEGEFAFPALIETLASGGKDFEKVPGLAYRENGEVVVNPVLLITDVDDLEYPWRVANPLDYANGMGHGFMAKRQPVCPVISSRGCPYQCTFCAGPSILGHKLRLRDPQKFVDEIQYLVDTFGIREIQIVDDNFTFYREHVTQVCEEILKRGLEITWSLPNGIRADSVNYSLLKLMKEAGCYYLALGVEFGSERMLKISKKSLSLDKMKQTAAEAAELGYITQGFFMMGYPQEKKEDVLATIDLAKRLPLDRISVNAVVPLPGSDLFRYYLEKGYLNLESVDWERFAGPEFIPRSEFLTEKELLTALRTVYTSFYLSPRRIIRYLFKIRSVSQIKGLWAGVLTLLRSLVRRGRW